MLHAVDATSADRMRTGMRVRLRWAERTGTGITDIECFEPEEDAAANAAGASAQPQSREPVTMITTTVRLSYDHTVSPGENAYLLAYRVRAPD